MWDRIKRVLILLTSLLVSLLLIPVVMAVAIFGTGIVLMVLFALLVIGILVGFTISIKQAFAGQEMEQNGLTQPIGDKNGDEDGEGMNN